jgi:hypothetical protein
MVKEIKFHCKHKNTKKLGSGLNQCEDCLSYWYDKDKYIHGQGNKKK